MRVILEGKCEWAGLSADDGGGYEIAGQSPLDFLGQFEGKTVRIVVEEIEVPNITSA